MPATIKYVIQTRLILQGLKVALVLAASIPLRAKSKEEGFLLLLSFLWNCVSGNYFNN